MSLVYTVIGFQTKRNDVFLRNLVYWTFWDICSTSLSIPQSSGCAQSPRGIHFRQMNHLCSCYSYTLFKTWVSTYCSTVIVSAYVVLQILVQVDYYDEERHSVDGFKQIVDTTAGNLEPYLLNIYFKIIKNCLLKHSKRCTSEKVSAVVFIIIEENTMYVIHFAGYGVVVRN